MMATLTAGFAVGDTVTVNEQGVNHVASDPTETMAHGDDVATFLAAGMRGVVVGTRINEFDVPRYTVTHEVAVRFHDDPVPARAWWMCHDEIVKEG